MKTKLPRPKRWRDVDEYPISSKAQKSRPRLVCPARQGLEPFAGVEAWAMRETEENRR